MKKIHFLLFIGIALLGSSCIHVTKSMDEVFAPIEEEIVYHDKKFMKSKAMYVPHGVDEKNLGAFKFNMAFEQDAPRGAYDVNGFDRKGWQQFQREYDNAIKGTNRLPRAQTAGAGLSDSQARRDANNGVTRTAELDYSKMSEAQGLLHINPTLSMSDSQAKIGFFRGGGYLVTTTSTMKITCDPLRADNNETLDSFQSFSVQTKGVITQRANKYGDVTSGFVFNSTVVDDLHLMQARATLVMFFNKLYELFPVGGSVVNFDEDGNAVIRASRSTGVQPDMEFVIYAMRKADGDAAIRVPLFNATAVSVGQTGSTTLKIWRKNSEKTAKKIIKQIDQDFGAAKSEYNFYGCSDGLAHWPDFIQKAFNSN